MLLLGLLLSCQQVNKLVSKECLGDVPVFEQDTVDKRVNKLTKSIVRISLCVMVSCFLLLLQYTFDEPSRLFSSLDRILLLRINPVKEERNQASHLSSTCIAHTFQDLHPYVNRSSSDLSPARH